MWVGFCCPKAVGLRKRHAPNLTSWSGGIFGVGAQGTGVSAAVTGLKAMRPRATPSSIVIVCGMLRERFIGSGVLLGRAHNPRGDHAGLAGLAGPSGGDASSVALYPPGACDG